MVRHRHHIIPKHAGGTDDRNNIAILTPQEHAEAHWILYYTNGKKKADFYAACGLDRFLGKEEIIERLLSENGKRNGKRAVETGQWAKASALGRLVGGKAAREKTIARNKSTFQKDISSKTISKTNQVKYSCSCGKQMNAGCLARHKRARGCE